MADERKQKTAESRLNDVFAGDDELGRENEQSELRDVNDPAEDEQRAWSGDLEARKRNRSDSITAIPADDRAMHDREDHE
jgi:hypothetical protein